MSNENKASSSSLLTRKRKFTDRFFPAQYCELPEAPATFKDCLCVDTIVVVDWTDRLRLLVSGRLMVKHKVICENEVGSNVVASVFYVLPPQ